MSFSTVVNECSFKTGFNAGNAAFVDICFFRFVPRTFNIQIQQTLAIDERDTQLFF